MNQNKLYAVVLGGRADGCQIELHDVVFAIGKVFEETYETLRNKWFGNKKRLHIDSYVELNLVDGHEVTLTKVPPQTATQKLFLVNFGGYKEGHFGEHHEIGFFVASGKPEALARAKQMLCLNTEETHCDDNITIDDIVSIDQIDQHYVHLNPTQKATVLRFNSGYRRL